ncbi:excalibur calcium-binding domain-containing protein [Domibacillus indicus]
MKHDRDKDGWACER